MSAQLTQLITATELRFTIWHDPAVTDGIQADSDDALVWLTPVVGPSAVLILHRVSRYLASEPVVTFTPNELAGAFGLATGDDHSSVSSAFGRALQRLEMFGMIRPHGNNIEVRTIVPPLAQRHLHRMPAYLLGGYPWPALKA